MTPQDLARFHAGDPALFREIVEEYSPRLLGLCRAFGRGTDEGHDLLQDAWLRVWAGRRSYRGGSLGAWLVAVCRRVCLSHARSSRPVTVSPGGELVERAPSGAIGPGADAERAELRAAIATALLDLPARQREVVVHRLLEGRSTRETALAMGCAEGTVKASLHQALRKLSEPLRPHATTGERTDARGGATTHPAAAAKG
ncbi:MAG: sigma-70 family RNA polymerase sigma factor [Gemmatimonadota bacterium]|nr:sigma-70 family RNA polymerase sigma factor [Gemmatimonadota bacterium]